jgi:hypothetical protein
MPLLMGDWRLFVGGTQTSLVLRDLQASGRFKVSANQRLSTNLFPALPAGGSFPMDGEGFWNEVGQAISFSLTGTSAAVGNVPVTLQFTGYQVQPVFVAPADPAQDLIWTLVGEFRHALAVTPPLPSPALLPNESARRFIFGWYAQITQVI